MNFEETTIKGIEAVIKLRLRRENENVLSDRCIQNLAEDVNFYLENLYTLKIKAVALTKRKM